MDNEAEEPVSDKALAPSGEDAGTPEKSDRSGEFSPAILEARRYHAGPLPPASELQRYDSVIPGLAERIVVAWESEIQHRRIREQSWDDRAQSWDTVESRLASTASPKFCPGLTEPRPVRA